MNTKERRNSPMRKKFFAVVTAIMVLAMGTTCFAAESGTTNATTETKGITMTKATEAQVTAAKAEAAKSVAEKAEVVSVFELTADTAVAEKKADGTYEVTVKIASVAATDNIVVLHGLTDGSWEKLAAKAGAGTVTFSTKTFSPFAIVKVPAASAAPEAPKAPATGVAFPIAGVVALVSAAGAAVCTKKARA